MTNLRCWLIGNQGLLTQCGQVLVDRGHVVQGVTSKSEEIVRWAAALGIAVNDSARAGELLPLLSAAQPDLLFSIGNDEILRPAILAVPRIASANYHDGPLPRYAGVHATTWALLAGEKMHGVTWHRIAPGIDEGAVLAQSTVPIEPGDTAFLLNLRCHEAGFETFLELLKAWESGGVPAECEQDLSRRTLYPRFRRPPNALVMDWTQPAIELDRLCRATDFGGRLNPFGIARAFLDGQFFLVLETVVIENRSAAVPGTVILSSPTELHVAAGEGVLAIRRVASKDGQLLAAIPIVREGSQLPLLHSEDARRLSSVFLQSLRLEGRTAAAYASVPRFELPEWMLAGQLSSTAGLQFVDVEIPEGSSLAGDLLLGCFVAFWMRKCAGPPFRVDLILSPVEGIFSPCAPVVVKEFDGGDVIGACDAARNAIRSALEAGPVLGDFFLRHPQPGKPENGAPSDLSIGIRDPDPDAAPLTRSHLHLASTPDGAHARLWFDAGRMASPDATRIAVQFSRFIDAALRHPETPLVSVPLLDDRQYSLAIHGWNSSEVPYELDRTFLDLFIERVRAAPEATAVLFEGQSLTYAELNRRAAACALRLSELGIAHGQPAGVFLDRSADLIVAILAVMKTGAAYLPLDPIYPDARLEQIVEDAGASLLISEPALRHRLAGYKGPRFVSNELTVRSTNDPCLIHSLLSGEWVGEQKAQPSSSLGASDPQEERFLFTHPDAHPDRPAYLICTSGSTGKPKGVPILHRSLTNLLLAYAERTGFNASDKLLAVSSIGFDWSILDLFLPLAHGARLEVLSSAAIRDGQQLAERAESGEVTFLQGTPGTWRLMLAGGWSRPANIALACGGESLSRDLASQLHQRAQRLFHVYGPTETAVVSSGDLLEPGGVLHLGRPLANYRQYVLDDRLNPVAPGEVGEICIAGVGVSPGYLRRPDLNAKKFLPDPFRPGSGELLYRSGDMGKLLDDGFIQFAGRGDQQVKLRGFRIELEEIESRLMQSAGVRDAVVVLRKDAAQQERLVAFVVMKKGASLAAASVLSELGAHLPDYMVPSALVKLDALPLTVNKKVDRRHLATGAFSALETTQEKPASAPSTSVSVETEIVAIVANLLGVEPRRIDSARNFMDLGLDSIQLTSLTFALRSKLGLKVKLTTLYQHPTPQALARFLFPREAGIHDSTLEFPLSSIQRLMWTHEQLHPGTTAWHSPFAFHLNRGIHVENLRKAIELVVHRYSILRSVADAPQAEPLQRIVPPSPFQLHTGQIASSQMQDELRRFTRLPFTGIPIRAGIFGAKRGVKVLILVVHHRVQDGVSMRLLWERIQSAYSALQAQRPPELPPDQPYQALIEREQAWLKSDEAEQQRVWWRQAPPTGEEQTHFAGNELSCALAARQYSGWKNLQAQCRSHSLTPAVAGLAAWALLLVRRGGRRSAAITLPVFRRPRPEDAAAMGNYLNLVPVAIEIPAGATVARLWEITGHSLAEALDHADLPLAEILQAQKRAAPQVAFYGPVCSGQPPSGPLFARPVHDVVQQGEIALALEMIPEADACRFQLKFDTRLHTPAAAGRLLDEFVMLLDGALANPAALVDELPLMSAEERRQVVVEWNRTAARFPLKTPVQALIAEQAARTPEAAAVLDANESLTYLALDRLANRIANALGSRKCSGMPVGVLMERSVRLPAALLGILKAGCHYLPLDPGFPRDRLRFLLEDSEAALVISEGSTRHLLPAGAAQMVPFDDLLSEAHSDEDPAAPNAEIAYLIYTSGSTGQPKGTLIPHRAFTNFLCAMRKTIPLKAADRLLAVTTISFDIAGLELFLPLICGASVDIAPASVARDGIQLRQAIESRPVSLIQATPATYRMILDADWSPAPTLRILCGGEALPLDLAQRLMRDGAQLWNLYGPTEATIWATAQRILPGQKIAIGRPIANTRAYVLDRQLQPVPPGVAGELFLAGECLASGYHKRPELTAAQFVRNPFASGRMYRTGDLAEWTSDGVLVHLGRADQQIKLRGMRIEIGEIEAALRRLQTVRDAAVLLKRGQAGLEQLVAFVQRSRQAVDWDPRAELAAWLPPAMVPSRFIDVDAMPLTPNRKIDRAALAALPLDEPTQLAGPVTPQAAAPAVASAIAQALGDVVGMDPAKLDRDRHLGEYGLDSIRFTRLAVLLSRSLGQTIEPPIFYEFTTLAALEKHFAATTRTTDSPPPANQAVVQAAEKLSSSAIREGFVTGHDFSRAVDAEESAWALAPAGGSPPISSDIPRSSAFKSSTASSPFENPAAAEPDPVAIVGMSGVFAGSETLDEFWRHLMAGDDMVTGTPASRWTGPQPGWGSFVDSIAEFDNAFFGISPREAEQMDPQQRLLLRCLWRIFENAGHAPADFAATACGVYVGASGFDYSDLLFRRNRPMEPHTLSGASHAVLANRVSFLYDLRGPSAAIDTACSSSLVAIHRAAAAIRSGECTAAIAGGVSVILSPSAQIALQATNMLSPEGRCKTFDASADGYVRGEGAALVLLRPLSAALSDRDRILGILRGSAENHGGRTNSLTAPSVSAQADVIASAHRQAALDPRSITYIEAHGTGTALGDPIEVNGLKNAFAALYAERGLAPSESASNTALGSLKTNFGHLEAAAGAAGLIKVLLAIDRGRLPGSLHLRRQNPMIKLEGSPFRLLTEAEVWRAPDSNTPLRAGISSFGFGGSNAHVVVEAPPTQPNRTSAEEALLIPVSGADAVRTASQCQALASWLASNPGQSLHDVAFTLQHGRASLESRVVFLAWDRAGLIAALRVIQDSALPRRPVSLLPDQAAEPALEAIAVQWLAGNAVIFPHIPNARRVDLPPHPFERTVFPLDLPTEASVAAHPEQPAPLSVENGSNSLGRKVQNPPLTNPKLRLRPTEPPAGSTQPSQPGFALLNPTQAPSPSLVLAQLRRELAEVLYSQEAALDPRRPFVDQGVDSILAIEFVRKVSASLGRTVRASDLYDHPNLEALAAHLAPSDSSATPSVSPHLSNPLAPASTPQAIPGNAAIRIRATLARVLYCDPSGISSIKPFSELGLDSILAVEFVRELSREFGVGLSAATLYDHSTLDALTAHLSGARQAAPAAAPAPVLTAVEPPVEAAKPQQEATPPVPPLPNKAVAIVGFSGRFPGAPNLEKFWDNLDNGVCSVTPIPADQPRSSQAPSRPRFGGFLDDVDRFDPLFFSISPTDAELMDPQHRLFLSEAYRAIENAGYAPESMAGQAVGVYAGVTGSDGYSELLPGLRPAQEMLGAADSILAGRVAYFLDFRGPALTVDTACSSSLVAIHLACRSLLGHETDLALAGGVTLYLSEKAWMEMEHAEMLASDGLCKTFDQKADGFVPGEGVGVLALKRLEDALAAGDSIRAVILGTGINQDGRTNGLTAPSAKSQAALEAQVYRNAGIDPATVTCVEAHGTGTKLGDPIEVEGLTRAFREFTGARQYCAIGSVKTNIGHTTAAAGVAGVLKMAGAFQRGHIPPTLHCTVENEHIDFASSPFFVNRELRAWPPAGTPRRAAVSSFGFSGTNAHLVLEEPPTVSTPQPAPGEALILLSARTSGALGRRVAEFAGFLDSDSRSATLADLAFTLARGRAHFAWRAAFVASSAAELLSQLRAWTPPKSASEPDPLLTEMTRSANFASADRPRSLGTFRELYLRGVDLPLDAIFPNGSARRVALPAYPFERDRCWAAGAPAIHGEEPTAQPQEKTFDLPAFNERRYLPTDREVAGHVVDGQLTLPGAAALLLVLESVPRKRYEVAGISWTRPIPVPPGGVTVRVEYAGLGFRVTAGAGIVHAEGRLQPLSARTPLLAASNSRSLPAADFYSAMKARGVEYGGQFRRIETLAVDRDGAGAWLLPGSETEQPSVGALDSALQVAGALASEGSMSLRPAALEQFALYAPWPARAEVRMRRTAGNRFDAEVLDCASGRLALSVAGLTLRQSSGPAHPPRDLRPILSTAGLASITPALWTRADTERTLLNRYAVTLASEVLPRIESSPATIQPLYQPMLRALKEMAARAGTASTAALRKQHAALIRKFDLLDRCAAALPAVLQGEQLGTAVLFEDGGSGLAEIYASSATAQVSNAAIARLVAAAKPLSVLEFGAGTGATTRAVLEAFADAGHRPERYLFTDISTTLLDAARAAFPSCEFARLDVTRPAQEQNVAGDFDVVFGTNALHVAPHPASALENLRALVRRGGLLILNEATQVDDYAVFTFGLTTGWWKAAEPGRIPHSPLLSSRAWLDALVGAGFAEPVDWTAGRAFYGDCGQSILVASVGLKAEAHPTGATSPELRSPLMDGDRARGYVRHVLAKVLKIDIARIEDSIGFENYGVDSLVVLEINRAFEKDLGRLPVTLLFENTTVAKLAAYFERDHAAALQILLSPPIATPPIATPLEPVAGRLSSSAIGEGFVSGHDFSRAASAMESTRVLAPAACSSSISPEASSFSAACDTHPTPAPPAHASGDPTGKIAIVGVAGRYPLSPDIESLWDNLLSGRDAIRPVPDDRWKWQNAAGLHTTQAHARQAGYLDGVDRFDPLHFGISPREAVLMDPQQRLFLEIAAEALEVAGYTQRRLAAIDRQVGVFAGAMNFDYDRLAADAAAAGIPTAAHSAHWSIANRVSFCLNLEGPSMAVDTACSASLSAIHLACESLRRKECRLAVAGGVNLILHPRHLDQLAEAGMLSADDRCRAFGSDANGFADGEGAGAIVLKPLEDAVRDRDTVWAVILGSAINAGGRTGGYTVPNPVAQAAVVRRALSSAGVDPETISYIEAHGTGTALGDPIEIAGLKSAFGDRASSVAIGSAKSNFGHLESAAGVLALTKTVLQIRYGIIAPTLHVESLNPLIEWDTLPFRPVQSATPWTEPRRAGVSSFGAGGANAHIVMEEGPPAPPADPSTKARLFVLSARQPDRLDEYRDRLVTFLTRHPETPLADLAWTLQAGRDACGERLAVIASTTPQLIAALRAARIPTNEPAPIALDVALRTRDLAALAAHWISGASIDWTRIDPFGSRRWIPAPTYPYARERYWIPSGKNAPQEAVSPASPAKTEANSRLDWLYVPRWLEQSAPPITPEIAADASLPDASLLIVTPDVPVRAWPGSLRPVLIDPMDADCIDRALAGDVEHLRRAYFVAGVGVSAPDPLDPAAFEYAQESGVIALFRLIRLLRQKGPRSLDLAVVTQSLPADSGAIPSPALAAIDGFVRSVRSEFPEWRVCCFDVSWTLLNDPVALMKAAGEEWAAQERNPVRRHGEGRRQVRMLEPMASAEPQSWTWREGAHYLILGGAGGIGLETAAHLCRNARAKVTLLGRRAPDDALLHRIGLEVASGGSIEYLQADATSETSLTDAVRKARERFGPIRGAFHSALVLEDRTIDRMGEAALRRVLDSKSATSVYLARALGSDPLDFLLFYSSAESFAGDAGQSNYSAGSTFQDAFARTLADSGLLPAKVINWGYWGSVGAVSGPFYRERLKRGGLDSIPVHEGMQAIEAALADPEPQVLAIKANRKVLHRLGLVENPEPNGTAEQFLQQIGKLEHLGRLRLLAVLKQAGAALSPLHEVSRRQLLAQLGVRGLGKKILDALLHLLTRAGLCTATANGWIETNRRGELPAWETFGLPHHAKLLRACLDALPAILRGETSAVDVLFGADNAASIAAMYQGDPVNDGFNQSIAEAALRFVEQRDRQRGANNTCRILEIGAGTGGTTAAVLARLRSSAPAFDYTYTDISPAFLRRGRERFGAGDLRLRFALLDIERTAAEQGFADGPFDLILAANVLHATRDLARTLGRVRGLLSEGGELLLNEAVAAEDFLTLTFGLLPGWWVAEDAHRRHPHSALAPRSSWEEVLKETGFDLDPAGVGDRVFIAHPRPARAVDEPVEVIRLALAETLQVPLGRIGNDTLFLDLGMDSLTALEAVALMNIRLGQRASEPLSSMDMYNFPSVGALARRLQLSRDEKPPQPAADAPGQPDSLRLLLDQVASGSVDPDAAVDSLMLSLGW
jgi:amino acid adenylation domain-containing protein